MRDQPSWTDVDAAFDHALDLDEADRDAYLAGLGSPLRVAVESLVRDALRDDPLLDFPQVAHAALVQPAPAAPVVRGARVGPYEVGELVGEGGMGRVYRAFRADGAYERTVALKVVRHSLTLAGADVAARLERERTLLATLDHPGIARLVDGGETDDGVPYLVTEFVEGAPITRWADERSLGVRERVGLMIEVARAVDHAHRRFVVHRDLKPSNVLVTEGDAGPRPIVLDFGIAKLLDAADESAAFPVTRTGLRLLTPAYAAPELYASDATVTTAADVYGLGALLYELLTGRRPHDDRTTTGPPTTVPTHPSQINAGNHGQMSALPGVASRSLRGDLDTICLKALHPDPARRYESASALADDLGRYLDGRPIEARRDSLAYVASRFAQRHRSAVATGAFAVLSLFVALAVMVVSVRSERAALAASEAALGRATDAADLVASLFHEANPEKSQKRALLARDALTEGIARVESIKDPALRAQLLGVLGETYAGIGDVLVADSLFAAGLALAEGLPDGRPVLLARLRLGYADSRSRLSDNRRAVALLRQVVAVTTADDPVGVQARRQLIVTTGYIDDLAEARRLAQTFVSEAKATGDPAAIVETMTGQLTLLTWVAERADEAIPVGQRLRVLSDSLYGPDHRMTRVATSTLAHALGLAGRHREAIVLYHESLRANIRVHGAGSRDEAYVHITLGDEYRKLGEYRASREQMRIGIEMAVPYIGASHRDVGWWRVSLAELHNRLGEHAEAEAEGRLALAIADADSAAALRARALGEAGLAVAGQGRREEAQDVLRQAAEALRQPIDMPPSYDEAARARLRAVEAALVRLAEA